MEDDARRSLLSPSRPAQTGETSQNQASFYDYSQPSVTTKILQLAFVVVVVAMVLISFILSIYRSAVVHNGVHVLLGLALVGFLAVEVFMILFIRHGDLAVEKTWFLYAVGLCIVLQCIFTNILIFHCAQRRRLRGLVKDGGKFSELVYSAAEQLEVSDLALSRRPVSPRVAFKSSKQNLTQAR